MHNTKANSATTARRILGAVKVGDRFYTEHDEAELAAVLRPEDLERLKAAGVIEGEWTASERPDDDVTDDEPGTAPGKEPGDEPGTEPGDDDDDDAEELPPVVPSDSARTRTPQPPPAPKPVPPVPPAPPAPKPPTPPTPTSRRRK